jgi:hypothetical protein
MNWSPSNKSNPFLDDDLRVPPPVPKEVHDIRPIRNSPSMRTRLASTALFAQEEIKERSEPETPVRIHIVSQQPVRSLESEIEQIQFERSSTSKYPKNPLRDEP